MEENINLTRHFIEEKEIYTMLNYSSEYEQYIKNICLVCASNFNLSRNLICGSLIRIKIMSEF